MTTSSTASDEKFVKMTTYSIRCYVVRISHSSVWQHTVCISPSALGSNPGRDIPVSAAVSPIYLLTQRIIGSVQLCPLPNYIQLAISFRSRYAMYFHINYHAVPVFY